MGPLGLLMSSYQYGKNRQHRKIKPYPVGKSWHWIGGPIRPFLLWNSSDSKSSIMLLTIFLYKGSLGSFLVIGSFYFYSVLTRVHRFLRKSHKIICQIKIYFLFFCSTIVHFQWLSPLRDVLLSTSPWGTDFCLGHLKISNQDQWSVLISLKVEEQNIMLLLSSNRK